MLKQQLVSIDNYIRVKIYCSHFVWIGIPFSIVAACKKCVEREHYWCRLSLLFVVQCIKNNWNELVLSFSQIFFCKSKCCSWCEIVAVVVIIIIIINNLKISVQFSVSIPFFRLFICVKDILFKLERRSSFSVAKLIAREKSRQSSCSTMKVKRQKALQTDCERGIKRLN